jgi:hypothetical protein
MAKETYSTYLTGLLVTDWTSQLFVDARRLSMPELPITSSFT